MACVVHLANKTPPEWGLVVETAGCQFSTRQGEMKADGPRNVWLRDGQETDFNYNDDGCVHHFEIWCTCKAPSEANWLNAKLPMDANPGKCMTERALALRKMTAVENTGTDVELRSRILIDGKHWVEISIDDDRSAENDDASSG